MPQPLSLRVPRSKCFVSTLPAAFPSTAPRVCRRSEPCYLSREERRHEGKGYEREYRRKRM
jgi:hypothetical protein